MSTFFSNHPLIGAGLGLSSGVTALLTWVKVLSPVIGIVGTIFGAAAAVLTFVIKLREFRAQKKSP